MKSNTDATSSRYSENMTDTFTAAVADEYFRLFSPAFCILDKKGHILRASRSFREIFAQEADPLSFDNISSFLSRKSAAVLNALLKEPEKGKAKLKAFDTEGRKRHLKIRISAPENSTGIFFLFFEDVTKIKELKKKQKKQEKLLIQQSKMAAMGEMLGVIAHQWKQPLNNLAIIAQTIGDDFDHGDLDSAAVEEHIDSINSQILFMSTTVDDFRRFFIPQKTPSRFSVMPAVEEIVSLINPQLKACNIDVRLSAGENCGEILGYRNEFKQVILNLVVNAKDAVIHRREEDERFRTGQGIIEINISCTDKNCTLSVKDNGMGISPDAMKKLFKPYFTTKNDNGTGIGLYLSKTIIENKMHGRLSAGSSASGASFTIILPSV